MKQQIDQLEQAHWLADEDWVRLLSDATEDDLQYLFARAREVRKNWFGTAVYLRGLIEITSYCRNDCRYCGIRHSNPDAERYRLTPEEVLACCAQGHALGFRTFVLQGGEDGWFTDERLVEIISGIKSRHPDCAITLSLGERSRDSYQRLFDAGADRYLLRHETANADLYRHWHPEWMSFEHRMDCLQALKDIGYQVGTGFMVGAPGQTVKHLIEDLRFIHDFQPQMVGIGPFIPHHATPFANQPAGTVQQTLLLLGVLRLMMPNLLLPATTALGTLGAQGREQGLLAGANVIMPNLSPAELRRKYMIYDNKLSTGAESAEGLDQLNKLIQSVGYHVEQSRGDAPTIPPSSIL